MAKKKIAQGIGKLIKAGLRKAYQGKTAPLQTGSKIANKLAPNSKIAATLAAIANPAMLQEGPPTMKSAPTPRRDSPEQAPTQPRPSAPRGSSANTRGTFTARKRTGEGDQGSFDSVMPTMGMPGQDMMTPMPVRQRARRMKAGGLAIKGQGKAFLKSKR